MDAAEEDEQTQTPDANATVSSLFKCGFWHHPATIEGPLTAHARPVSPHLPPPRSLPGPPRGGLLNAIDPAAGLVNATVLLEMAGSGLEKVEPEDAGGVDGDEIDGDGHSAACVAPAASADFPSPEEALARPPSLVLPPNP